MPFVYILECSDGSFYVGSTFDIDARLSQHNDGKGAKYTARRRPVQLRWMEEMDSIEEAYVLEKRVQGWSRAKRLALIEGRLSDLPRLSKRGYRPSQDG
ncbi:GIY-YIG nuclease family protein [Tessaracoccus sp. Y36]